MGENERIKKKDRLKKTRKKNREKHGEGLYNRECGDCQLVDKQNKTSCRRRGRKKKKNSASLGRGLYSNELPREIKGQRDEHWYLYMRSAAFRPSHARGEGLATERDFFSKMTFERKN